MTSFRPRKSSATTRANDDGAPQLQHLMRAIVAIAVSTAPDSGSEGKPEGENVLVDTDLDGMRYLLVRMPLPDRARLALSPRELEIVRMVAQGHPNKIIAGILNISTWTVCAHVRRIFAKLGVTSRAAMVARLLEFDRPLAARVNGSVPAAGNSPRPQTVSGSAGRSPLRNDHVQASSTRAVQRPRAVVQADPAPIRGDKTVRAPIRA